MLQRGFAATEWPVVAAQADKSNEAQAAQHLQSLRQALLVASPSAQIILPM
jgi:hypothetical protein